MIHVTHHAIERYQERIAAVSETEARERILTHEAAILTAHRFGAPVVKCSNMKLVLRNGAVATVLQTDMRLGPVAA